MTEEVIDMAELFARDPLQLSNADLETIISKMRESRKNFLQGDKTAGSTKPLSEEQQKVRELGSKLSINL